MAGISDTGMRRDNNEDNILVDDKHYLAMVADGMGGHNAGEVASELAIKVASQFLLAGLRIEGNDNDAFVTADPLRTLMNKSIQLANHRILEAQKSDEEHRGMGTTIVSLLFCKNWFVIGNVGDSRCYRYRDKSMTQMTVDHSWVQGMIDKGSLKEKEARKHPQRGLLLQAMGNREIEPSFVTGIPLPGDVYLLCSDGLTEAVNDKTIEFVLSQNGSPQKTAEKLVELANENGGPDNVSVVVARISERPQKATVRASLSDFDS
jgi:protein phosphatase